MNIFYIFRLFGKLLTVPPTNRFNRTFLILTSLIVTYYIIIYIMFFNIIYLYWNRNYYYNFFIVSVKFSFICAHYLSWFKMMVFSKFFCTSFYIVNNKSSSFCFAPLYTYFNLPTACDIFVFFF